MDLTTLCTLLGESFQATTTEHFVLLHETGAGYAPRVGRTLEQAYRHFYEAFSRAGFDLARAPNRLVWICFPQKSGFNQYVLQAEGMNLSWLDGYYSTLTNRVAIVQADQIAPHRERIDPPALSEAWITLAANSPPGQDVLPAPMTGEPLDVTRLTHELAHQLSFNSGIQKRGVMYPLWVSEGLATNFEFKWPAHAGLERGNPARCNCVVDTYAAGELVPLREFVIQTKVPPDTYVGRRHYAQAWAFFRYILAEHPQELRVYLQRLTQHQPGSRSPRTMLAEFTDAFGRPEALEDSWTAFLEHQARAASTVSPAASLSADTRAAQLP